MPAGYMMNPIIVTLTLGQVVVSTQPQDAVGRIPLAEQISEMLTREIQTGVLPDGERLPPERELAQRLHISVGTLRKALAHLEESGLLRRIQGSGNYVRNLVDEDNVYALFRLQLKNRPGTPSASLLSIKQMNKPGFVPDIGDGKKAFRFRRIRSLDEHQCALEEIWLDGRYAQSINKTDVGNSLYRFYRDHLGFRITRAEDRVSVASLPTWAPEVLQKDPPNHWGFIERLSRDQGGRVAEYSRSWFNPDLASFVAR